MRRLPLVPTSPLPQLYDGWMREALGGSVPNEPESTCSDCAMVAAPGDEGGHAFDPHAKCCTHFPFLPNFLVGRILADRDPAGKRGRASTRARIADRIAISPLGLRAPGPRRMTERLANQHGEFGRVRSLVCPHFIDQRGGLCGIWRHRNAVCVTFFCKHERGSLSGKFWRDGLEPLLKAVENALARHALLDLDFPADALARVLALSDPDDVDTVRGPELAPDPMRYAQLWGPWESREEELYAACAERVSSLAWQDVLRLGGSEVEARARIARRYFEDLGRREIPKALRVGAFTGVQVGRDVTRVATYNPLDPLDLPNVLVTALARFDGRPTRTVLRELAKKDGLELDDELLGRLVDFEILVPADAPPRA